MADPPNSQLHALPAHAQDQAVLGADGKKEVLKREWNFWAVLGMAACTLATWEATSALFAGAYLNGGPASVVYGFIVSVLGTLCIAASFAEMASISPIAGAQYHWTADHAPPSIRVFVSYIQGWVTVLAWQAGTTSVIFLVSGMIQALAIFNYPSYVPERWHVTLMMIGFSVLFAISVTWGKRFIPAWETLTGVLHVLFFFIVMISLLATSEKAPSKAVWGTFINGGGWPSDGVSFCIGFLTPAFALAGIDAVVHMSEETYNPTTNVPRAMIWAVVINGVAAFAYILTVLYSITDVDAVLNTPTGFPIIAVFYQATGNARAATAMMCSVILIFLMALFGIATSTSRLMWAFARDGGLPFSTALRHLTPTTRSPTRCVWTSTLLTVLLSLINIGSTTAFNAFLSLSTIGFYFSYGIPTLLFLLRRSSSRRPIHFGPWRMPAPLGAACNALAVAFCVFLVVFTPFPPQLPVTAANMNYAAPMFGAVIGFAVVDYWVRGRGRYRGPVVRGREVPAPGEGAGAGVESVLVGGGEEKVG